MGKDAIHHRLVGLQAQLDKITTLVVAIDSDDDANVAFTKACEQFAKANTTNPAKAYVVPTAPNILTAGTLRTAIILVPAAGTSGCLDSLPLPSFEQTYPGRPKPLDCVDNFCTCLADPARGFSKDARLRLRALIAATQRNPGASLANLLEEGHCPIDFAHTSFDPIKHILTLLFP